MNLGNLVNQTDASVSVNPRDILIQAIGLANSLIGGRQSNTSLNTPEVEIPLDTIV